MTLLSKKLKTNFGQVEFHVQRSCRYHLARQNYYEILSRLVSFGIILISGIWAITFPDLGVPWVYIGPSIIVVISALDITFKPSAKGVTHKFLAHQFNQLEIKMIESENTDELAAKFQAERRAIEATEPPSREVLDVVIHNKLCQANDREDYMYHISFLRRILCQFLDWPPKKWEYIKDREARKLKSSKPELQASA